MSEADSPRLAPLPPDEWGDDARAALADAYPAEVVARLLSTEPGSQPMPNALAHDDASPRARGPVPRRTTTCCCNGPRSSPAQRELVVLRVAWRTRSRYEWVQHLRLAPTGRHHARGDRRRSPTGPARDAWTPLEADLLAATDQLIDGYRIDDDTWKRLAEHLDERQLVELVFVVGTYTALAMAFKSFGLQLDPELQEIATSITSRVRGVSNDARSKSRPRAVGLRTTPSSGPSPMSYEDSISPELHELEREAIFKRSWLNVGRVEQLPRKGSYFTKELAVANTSVVIVRDLEGEVRAFYNICRHRGNKLVWTDFPKEESNGNARAVRVQVPRLEVRPRRRVHVRAAGGRVLRLRQGRLQPRARALRRVVGVHLREPRRRAEPDADRLPRADDHRARRLPVRQADRALLLPRDGRQQLEALHGRLPGVLPRTRFAREAVAGCRRCPKCRRPASKRCTTRSTARTAW